MKKLGIALMIAGCAQGAHAATATIAKIQPVKKPACEKCKQPSQTEASSGLKVTLGGSLDTQAGYRSQKKAFNKSAVNGDTLHNGAIVNETKIDLGIEGKAKALKYGGKISLYADTSPHYNGNIIRIADTVSTFVESPYGKAEFGNGTSASLQMQISANNIARLPGGINGKAQKWMSEFVYLPGATNDYDKFSSHFIKWPVLPIDNEHESAAGKVSYFTPKVYGLQAGVSYVVDSELHGTVAKTQSVAKTADKEYKNIIDGAIKYEGKFNEIELTTALTGQMGDAKRKTAALARNDLRAWELGAMVKYHGFSLAGSYSDWHHTGAPKIKVPGLKYGASYWTAGLGYEQGNLGTSITYFNSRRANINNVHPVADATNPNNKPDVGFNRFELVSLGVDYKLAPGFMPYAEVSVFRTKHKGAALSNKGSIILAGTKLTF